MCDVMNPPWLQPMMPSSVHVDVRQRLQVVDGRQHVVHFLAAVVDLR